MTLKDLGQLLICVHNSKIVITNKTVKLKLTFQQMRQNL